jgi:rod shape-determining protein MreB
VLSKLVGAFSADLGIDMGTANTKICRPGSGIVLSEPSVIAVKKGTRKVLLRGDAVGQIAKDMIGRTPLSIDAVKPMVGGVISDFDMTEALLTHFIRKVKDGRHWFSPRMVIATRAGINPVEKRAIFNVAERVGARKVYVIEEPRAAGLGAGIPIHEARAHMIVDVGGGTTDISVLSLADIVVSTSIPWGGDAMDRAIIQHVKQNYNILLGEVSAEQVKIDMGSACPMGEDRAYAVSGRDLIAGLPRTVTVTSDEIREALQEPVRQILGAIRGILEKTGPELSGDLVQNGITLCGGGVLLKGLPELIQAETGLPVEIADDPITAVVRGISVFLERLDDFKYVLETGEDDF